MNEMNSIKTDLNDRCGIVTGAGRGIGEAIALTLAKAGAGIIVIDINPDLASKVAKKIKAGGGEAYSLQADITKKEDVERLAQESTEAFDKIHILVNNAGITGPSVPLSKLGERDWDKVINTNLKGTFLVTKAVLGPMISQRYGKIVNISSIAGKEGNANMTAYCASKHGILGLTKSLAKEVAKYNIQVNAVCPALIRTPLIEEEMEEKQREYLKRKIPLGRLGEPEEVASLVHYLVSDSTDFITGQTFNITGGRASY